MIRYISRTYDNIMKFDCLTGLRPSKAVAPTQLINKRKEKRKVALFLLSWNSLYENTQCMGVYLTKKSVHEFLHPDALLCEH